MSNYGEWNKDLSFSEKMVTLIDDVLINKIPNIEKINRLKSSSGNVHQLDQHYAIDGEIIKKTGIVYTFQEKIRRYNFQRFNDFTLEYFSNVNKNIKGEFFHLCADFYIHGYANQNETSLNQIRIIDVTSLKKYIDKHFNKLQRNNLKQNNKHSNANFFTIPFNELEKENNIIVANYDLSKTKRKLKP